MRKSSSMRPWIALLVALSAAFVATQPRSLAAPQDDGKKEEPKKPGGKKDGAKKDGKGKKGAEGFGDVVIQDDVKDVPAKDLRAAGDEQKRYFLIAPKEKRPPTAGYALLVVMPGGTGEASFHNFVRRIWTEAIPDDWVVAQLVCVMWKPDQKTIWPTRFTRTGGAAGVPGQEFTTEEYFAAVVDDVQKVQKLKVDPARVYQMGWSSGGPAEYAIALQEKHLVTGSYVAMSVFHDKEFANDLKWAKGQAFFLDHSPDDTTCKFEHATLAKEQLGKAGATVELVTYPGGHAWVDDPYARMRKGFAWLDENHGKPAR